MLVILIYLVLVSSIRCKQLRAQCRELPEHDFSSGLYCQMLTLKFSSQHSSYLADTAAINNLMTARTPDWQGLMQVRSVS
jgi:hypothetical protein